MKFIRSILAILLFLCQAAWAQEPSPTPGNSTQPNPQTLETPAPEKEKLPLDVAGYVSFRHLNGDDLEDRDFHQEYSGSLFLSKTIGRWRLHAEFNLSNVPEFDADGIHLLRPLSDLSVDLDNGFLNYNARDWLQVKAGFLFVQAYWREHRYQSTVLTVDDPLIDESIFPTAFKGAMVYGDKYFAGGGFSYQLYGGVDQQTSFVSDPETTRIEGSNSIGGKIVAHLPSRHFFETFDVGFHRLHRSHGTSSDELYGGEMHLVKGRMEFLAEYAHASEDIVHGHRESFRQGYYLQPSYRITRKLFAVVRYDRLNRDSRFAEENDQARQSAGFAFRPVPALSLKVEMDRYEPQAGRQAAYYGPSVGIVYFFHP